VVEVKINLRTQNLVPGVGEAIDILMIADTIRTGVEIRKLPLECDEWLQTQPYEVQRAEGIKILQKLGTLKASP
jgi:hypothetical protein